MPLIKEYPTIWCWCSPTKVSVIVLLVLFKTGKGDAGFDIFAVNKQAQHMRSSVSVCEKVHVRVEVLWYVQPAHV